MSNTLSAENVVSVLTEQANLLQHDPKSPTQEWTRSMLGALAKLGDSAGHCVDPISQAFSIEQLTGDSRVKRQEFLWDLAISSWPRYSGIKDAGSQAVSYGFPHYFEETSSPELVLVAESEWGHYRDARANGLAVLEDFAKLLAARCPLKVMIFSYHGGTDKASYFAFNELVRYMKQLVDRSTDDATYVFFGVAWNDEKPGFHPVVHRRQKPAQ
ncbi:MAG: hypothetical protein RLZZ450_5396 [Pseudomonadota bacterium]|jgi:hypothetical protein